MKASIYLLLLFAALSPLCLCAQSDKEDVIYMKDGSIYRGTIVEQIPNVSYKIEIAGGSLIVLSAGDIKDITKEDKKAVRSQYYRGSAHIPSPVFRYRERCFFFQGRLHTGVGWGSTLVFGYKFKYFAQLGLGSGFDIDMIGIGKNAQNAEGLYVPLFAQLCGDLLKEKITPYYQITAGYGFSVQSTYGTINTEATKVAGGPMGGAGLGARFYSRSRWTNLIITANCYFQNARYWEQSSVTYYNPLNYGSYTVNSFSSGAPVMIIPTLDIAICF